MNGVIESPIPQVVTRPYVSLHSAKKDKLASVTIAVLLHAAIIAAAGASFIKFPEFGVDEGMGSIEVNLVAAPSEVVPQPPVETPVETKSEFVEQEIAKPVVQMVEQKQLSRTEGRNEVTVQSTGGAISEAKPDYLKNPAPVYPESARRRGHEGTVLLTVDVDKAGIPLKVTIERSSGHSVLDDVARKAVEKWKFRPGKLGNIPIDSTVRVPIKFYLNK